MDHYSIRICNIDYDMSDYVSFCSVSCSTANKFQCCVTQHVNKMHLKKTSMLLKFRFAYNSTAISSGFKLSTP